ncbi:ATP-dependent DNA helicase PIF2-like [Clytia hemisphaerica]|uniref:ATP-dependent DNA helicase PIF2-like n=1 Tax=Clytia hemisphaerica TaxID=252671 RepID=UPI0034D7BB5B
MIHDFLRHHSELQAEQMTLSNIANMLHQFGKSLQDFNLPDFDIEIVQEQPNAAANRVEADRVRPSLSEAQTTIADAVINALSNNDFNSAKLFLIDGPGGCGKTYTYNYIIKEARAQSFTVSTSSWTGIAATLFGGGKTCHSLFKLPVPVNDGSTCSVKPNSTHAEFLRNQDIFIFDEASMIPKQALEAVDRMLSDICNSCVPFAGKVVLLGGDFRQTLPVVKRGSPAQVVESCLKRSPLWPLAQVFHLNQNMRTGIGEQEFSNFLLRLGEGALPMKAHEPYLGCIEIPEQCVLPKDFADGEDLTKRVILTPTNEEALEINEQILQRQTGDVCSYFSFDSVVADTQEEVDLYPQEFLNSITPSGMPHHHHPSTVRSEIPSISLSIAHGLT